MSTTYDGPGNTIRRVRSRVYTPSIYTLSTGEPSSAVVPSFYRESALGDTEALGTLRRGGMVDGMFPPYHLLRNISRYMRFASASYGSSFLKLLGIAKGCPSCATWSTLITSCDRMPTTPTRTAKASCSRPSSTPRAARTERGLPTQASHSCITSRSTTSRRPLSSPAGAPWDSKMCLPIWHATMTSLSGEASPTRSTRAYTPQRGGFSTAATAACSPRSSRPSRTVPTTALSSPGTPLAAP